MNESSLLLQEFVKIKLVFVDQVLQEVSQICPVFEMLLLVRQVFNVIYRVVELFEFNFLFISVLLRQFAVEGLVESFEGVEAPWLLVEQQLQVVRGEEWVSPLARCRFGHSLLLGFCWFRAQLDVCGQE